jgi:hypothetical protein
MPKPRLYSIENVLKEMNRMKFETHYIKDNKIAELISQEIVIKDVEDAIDLLGNVYYQGFDNIIIHEKNLTAEFFNLGNGIAGEVLQKFSNYRIRLAIVGDFSKFTKKSIKSFIFESNNARKINFVCSLAEAINILSN